MSFILVLALLAPTTGPVSQDMNERALDLYDEGRFAEAAAVFEAIAAQDPKMYFEAGQMRFAAGHMAHASRHFEAYIASGLDDDARYIARTRLAKVALSTRRIEVRLTPVGVDASIVARRLDDPADRTRPELVTPAVAGSASLRLDPGPWELRVEAPGFLALRQVLEVRAANPTVVLQLVPVPAATSPASTADRAAPARELRRGRAQTAVGAVMLPLGLVGLGGFVAVAVGYGRTGDEYRGHGHDGYLCNDIAALGDLRTRARGQTGAMAGLGVASVGLLAAGTVWLVRGQGTLRRARLSLDLRPDRAGLMFSGSF